MLKDDLEAIKLIDTEGAGKNNTFILVAANLIYDQNGVAAVAAASTSAQQAAAFVKDTTVSKLTTGVFDMNAGVLNLSFSETVRNSTLRSFTIQLQNAATAPVLVIFWRCYTTDAGDIQFRL